MHVACVCASRNISVGGGWSPQHHVLVYVWIELYIFFFLTFTSLYNYALPLEYKPHEDRDRVYVVAFVTLGDSGPRSEINGDEQMYFERIAWGN